MSFDKQLVILLIRQMKRLLEIEMPHLFIGHVLSEQFNGKVSKGPSGFAQTVVKVNVYFHWYHTLPDASIKKSDNNQTIPNISSARQTVSSWLLFSSRNITLNPE